MECVCGHEEEHHRGDDFEQRSMECLIYKCDCQLFEAEPRPVPDWVMSGVRT